MRTKEEILKILNPDNHKGGHWTYAPIKHKNTVNLAGEEIASEWVQIHEVYFLEDGTVRGYIAENKGHIGNDIEDLKGALQMMLEACNKPVITIEELDMVAHN